MASAELEKAIDTLARAAPEEFRALLQELSVYYGQLALDLVGADSDRVLILQGGARQTAKMLQILGKPFAPTAESKPQP